MLRPATDDRSILLICMIIAFFFWFIVRMSQQYDATKQVVLDFQLPPGKALNVDPPKNLEARLRGTGWNLMIEFIAGQTLTVPFNLRNESSFVLDRERLLQEISKQLSQTNIQVTGVNFSNTELRLEEEGKRKLPLRLRASLRFAAEHQLQGPPVLQPDSVTVTGPESALRRFTDWETDSLVLSDLSTDQQINLSLTKPSDGLRLTPQEVQVKLEVEQFTQKSVWLPVTVRNSPVDSLNFFPRRIQANVVVGLSQYEQVVADSFLLVADLTGIQIGAGGNTVPVVVERRPDFVRSITLDRRAIEFYIVQPADRTNQQPN